MQNLRWSSAVATAALLALPVVAAAQSTPTTPPQPPATTSQPPATTSPQPPPASAQPPAPASAGQVDQAAAKAHLSEARDTLSQLTSLPEAAKLQGASRTQVSQLISNFNALITAQSDWRSAYAKVDSDLTSLLGPEASPDQPVGTSGSTSELDPAIRGKLVEFRTHLKAFETAAGGSAPPSASTSTAPASAEPPAPPAAAPPSAPTPATSSPVSPASPTATMDPSDRARAESAVSAGSNADAQKELDAISAIVGRSKTGTLTRAQTAELKKHVENLRVLLAKQ
jgi:hypothetical protein